MKRIFLFFMALALFTSCSVGNDNYNNYTLEILPVESVDIPQEFTLGEVYPITVSYYRPSTCYLFRDFYYEKENNIRTVAPINRVFESTCEPLDNVLTEDTFNFIVTSNGSYIFKFWQGKDSNDEDVYLTIEVPVVD